MKSVSASPPVPTTAIRQGARDDAPESRYWPYRLPSRRKRSAAKKSDMVNRFPRAATARNRRHVVPEGIAAPHPHREP